MYVEDGDLCCFSCGPQYVATLSLEQAKAEAMSGQTAIDPERALQVRLRRARRRQPKNSLELTPANDGCDAAPTCLACPLAECKYADDLSGGAAEVQRRNRALMTPLFEQGLRGVDIAAQTGLSRATVYEHRSAWRRERGLAATGVDSFEVMSA